MTTQTAPSLARVSKTQQRRPQLMLLAALLILLGAIGYRYRADRVAANQPAPPPAAIEPASLDAISQFEMRIQRNPNDAAAYAGLGLSLLQRVREQNDTTLYTRAGQAFEEALKRDTQDIDALTGKGLLALALHDFEGAIPWAEKAWAINPFRAAILGIKVDAFVELGRYDEAVETLQKMVDLRPDLHSYSRVSYLRELHGDVDGAIEAMKMAVESTPIGSEPWLWTLTHLGHLYFNRGNLAEAENIYQQVLQQRNDYSYALAGIARVQAAQGDLASAIATLQPVAERMPIPEFLTALGEFYQVQGDAKSATAQYELVGVIQQLNRGAGMNVDLELALFNADHGEVIGIDAATTLQDARLAYQERPTIYAADTLAWALYKVGEYEEAQKYSQEALRLETQDAILYFHAGMIATKLEDSAAAKVHLQKALEINPHFSVIYAPVAKEMVDKL